MPPNPEEKLSFTTTNSTSPIPFPLLPDSDFILLRDLSDIEIDLDLSSDIDHAAEESDGISEEEEEYEPDPNQILIPLEHNFRELLVKVTSDDNLQDVTRLKLRVIAADVPLQQLSVHTPALRELTLDGSAVSTLRDLGVGLRNLRILRVNRCGLRMLDGVFSLEGLEELYAADNELEDLVACTFLPQIRVIDVRRNRLQQLSRTLSFLSLCENLQHLFLEGNDSVAELLNYRQFVRGLLPSVRTLDGHDLDAEVGIDEAAGHAEDRFGHGQDENWKKQTRMSVISGIHSPRNRPLGPNANFVVQFPPRVCADMSKHGQKDMNKS